MEQRRLVIESAMAYVLPFALKLKDKGKGEILNFAAPTPATAGGASTKLRL